MTISALPVDEQIDRIKLYLRTMRTDANRISRELGIAYRKRKVCPFVESLRYERLTRAYELQDVGEECLRRLRQVRALGEAEFFPGDAVTREIVAKGFPRTKEAFVIVDVEPSIRGSGWHYVVWQIAKNGDLFKRGTTWMSPSNRIRIVKSELALSDEARRQADRFRDSAHAFMSETLERGKIDEIIKAVRERRARRGW